MNKSKNRIIGPFIIGISLLALILSGCTITLPTTWATHGEAFSSVPGNDNPGSDAGAYRSANFDYTYDEVFTSSIRALSFAQLNILDEDRDNGKIYAVRSATYRGSTQRYFYMVDIKEESGTDCSVRLYSKVQGTGTYRKWGPSIVAPSLAFLAIGIVGVATLDAGVVGLLFMALPYPIITVPMNLKAQKSAEYQSTLKWSPGDEEYLDRILSFIRTDLLQR
jgi:hypothetical protein